MRFLLGLFILALLVGCRTGPSSPRTGSTPQAYGARQIISMNGSVKNPVWSVDPKEYQYDGVVLEEPFSTVQRQYGNPLSATKIASNRDMVEYAYPNGLRVETRDGRVVLIEVKGPDRKWVGPRGIVYGAECATVDARFGPSHDGAGHMYYSNSPNSTVFSLGFICETDRVIGFIMTSTG